jgi:hypothetical protein
MNQCIESTVGTTIKGGYKQVKVNVGGRVYGILAHRMAFEKAWRYTLTPDQHVMHTCDNPPCVNPLHLQLGDRFKNMQDMVFKGRGHKSKTHCHKGHEFTEANTYLRNDGKHRYCRACRAERMKELRHG